MVSKSKAKKADITSKMLRYITDNFEDISLGKLARHMGYSKTHVCRLFKEDVGKSFTDILTDIRLSHAKSYLTNTNASIRRICYIIGYDSVEYFQRLFKKKIGMTPGEYREKHKIK